VTVSDDSSCMATRSSSSECVRRPADEACRRWVNERTEDPIMKYGNAPLIMSPTRFRPRPDERQDERHDRTCNCMSTGGGCCSCASAAYMMMMVMVMMMQGFAVGGKRCMNDCIAGNIPLHRDISITEHFRVEWNQMHSFVHVAISRREFWDMFIRIYIATYLYERQVALVITIALCN
jgi:hypothetical protein